MRLVDDKSGLTEQSETLNGIVRFKRVDDEFGTTTTKSRIMRQK